MSSIGTLFEKRLIINLGKGGVGKSVISAVMALLESRKGKKVLLVQLEAKDRISGYLGTDHITPEITEILPNLFAVNIHPQLAMKEYVLLQVKLEVIYKVVFENRLVSAFLNTVPALKDLVMLGKIEYHVNETNEDGKPKYDLIIVDGAATGHGLFFLDVPKVMAEAAISGPVKEHSERMSNLLKDPKRTAVNIVCIPEEMPVSEAIDAATELRTRIGIEPAFLFMNRILPNPFTPEEEQLVLDMPDEYDAKDPILVALRNARDMIEKYRMVRGFEQKLKQETGMPVVKLPELGAVRFGPLESNELARRLELLL